MNGQNKKQNSNRYLSIAAYICFMITLVLISSFSQLAHDETNVSVTLNVTNARPEIFGVLIYDGSNINLTQGDTHLIYCNVSVLDYNGFADIDTVNATFFHYNGSFTPQSPDNNNTHYTNTSCTQMSTSGDYANYSCGFEVYYYAVNGTWNCSVEVNDSLNFNNNNSNISTIVPLFAMNLTELVDYGDLILEDYSSNMTVNITNFGNMDINISVFGYGATPGDGLAVSCAQNNITIDNEKYSADPSAVYASKAPLTGTDTNVNLTVYKQWTPGTFVTNTTYWQIYVDPINNPFGVCNGTIVFNANPDFFVV